MDRIPVLDVKLRKVTCFKPGGNDFSTNQARRPAWPEIPGENTCLMWTDGYPFHCKAVSGDLKFKIVTITLETAFKT